MVKVAAGRGEGYELSDLAERAGGRIESAKYLLSAPQCEVVHSFSNGLGLGCGLVYDRYRESRLSVS